MNKTYPPATKTKWNVFQQESGSSVGGNRRWIRCRNPQATLRWPHWEVSRLEVALSAFAGGGDCRQDGPSSSVEYCSFPTHSQHKPSLHGKCRAASFAVRLRVSHHPFDSAPIVGLPLEVSFWDERFLSCVASGENSALQSRWVKTTRRHSQRPAGKGGVGLSWGPRGIACCTSLRSLGLPLYSPPACRPYPFSSLCLHKPLGKNTSHCIWESP